MSWCRLHRRGLLIDHRLVVVAAAVHVEQGRTLAADRLGVFGCVDAYPGIQCGGQQPREGLTDGALPMVLPVLHSLGEGGELAGVGRSERVEQVRH